MKQSFLLSIVVPVFNEEAVIRRFFLKLLKSVSGYNYEIIFVDDGSSDNSLKLMSDLCQSNKSVTVVKLKRNFGQQNAIFVGLSRARGDCVAVLDADLQDPPHYIAQMVEKWQKGYQIVVAQRKSRGDNIIKKINAYIFYRAYKLFVNRKMWLDIGDFYLLDKKVVKGVVNSKESRFFLRGAISKEKVPQTSILINRKKRYLGKTKYSFKKMLKLAFFAFFQSKIKSHWKSGSDFIEKIFYANDSDQTENVKKIAIIGGGISGLVIGFYLSKAGFTVTIFEKNKELGGFLESINIGKNKYVEKYYHHFFSCDKYLISLLTELGLQDKIHWQKAKTANFFRNKIYPYSSLSDSMRYGPISIFSHMRFVFGNLILLCLPASFFKLTTKELFDFALGKENWNKLWGILMEKKFGKYANKIGASWFVSRIRKKYSTILDNKIGYIKGGFKILIDALEKEILDKGGKIVTNYRVGQLKETDNSVLIDRKKFDKVISTIANEELNQISNKQIITQNKYLGVICVLILCKQELSPYYWINILEKRIPFICIIEHTNLVNKNRYSNQNLLYLSKYCSSSDPDFKKKDELLSYEWVDHFRKIFPQINLGRVTTRVFKDKYAQPINTKNYQTIKHQTQFRNVFSLTMAHIYPEDRGVNESIREAKKLYEKIC